MTPFASATHSGGIARCLEDVFAEKTNRNMRDMYDDSTGLICVGDNIKTILMGCKPRGAPKRFLEYEKLFGQLPKHLSSFTEGMNLNFFKFFSLYV